jgi:sorbitol-specific phosphotransferase system component IIC
MLTDLSTNSSTQFHACLRTLHLAVPQEYFVFRGLNTGVINGGLEMAFLHPRVYAPDFKNEV